MTEGHWECKEHGKEYFCIGNYIANLLNKDKIGKEDFTETDLRDEKDLRGLEKLVKWVKE